MNELKQCQCCKEAQPLAAFYRDKSRADGLDRRCKGCSKAQRKELHHRRPSMYIDYHNERRDLTRQKVSSQARVALKSGLLATEPCFICGEAAEMHHPVYSAPLLVTWLCKAHHRQLHAEHAALAEQQREKAVNFTVISRSGDGRALLTVTQAGKRFANQPWARSISRRSLNCSFSELPYQPGSLVYRPVGSPGNRDMRIIARFIDQAAPTDQPGEKG